MQEIGECGEGTAGVLYNCSCNFSVGFKLFFLKLPPPKIRQNGAGGRAWAWGGQGRKVNKWNEPVSAATRGEDH